MLLSVSNVALIFICLMLLLLVLAIQLWQTYQMESINQRLDRLCELFGATEEEDSERKQAH